MYSDDRALITNAFAAWLARLAVALPDLQLPQHRSVLVGLARAYLVASGSRETRDLDLLVGFAPWLDDGRAYAVAVDLGWVPLDRVPSPLYLPTPFARTVGDMFIKRLEARVG